MPAESDFGRIHHLAVRRQQESLSLFASMMHVPSAVHKPEMVSGRMRGGLVKDSSRETVGGLSDRVDRGTGEERTLSS